MHSFFQNLTQIFKKNIKSGISEKIFSANNEQGSMKLGEKWFPEKS